MKIKCDRVDLMDGLNMVLKAIPSKSTTPILECVLISAENGEIRLIGNNLELGIETKIEGEIAESGIAAIDAKLFSQIVSKLPDGEVGITVKDEAEIKCGKSKFKLACKDGSEFVYLPEVSKDKKITLNQYTVKEAVRQIIFSVSDGQGNKMMGGVCFEVSGDKLTLTALDGHRIAIREIDLMDTHEDVKVVIPGKTLNEISKILTDTGDLNIYLTEKHILVEFDNAVAVSRLIEGEYYDVSKMFTADYNTSLKIDRKGFTEALERTLLLVRDGDRKPVVLDIGEGVAISLVTNLGSVAENMEADIDGQPIKIGFNAKFLIDALKAIDDDTVTINMSDSKKPCFITGADYRYVILPINFA